MKKYFWEKTEPESSALETITGNAGHKSSMHKALDDLLGLCED